MMWLGKIEKGRRFLAAGILGLFLLIIAGTMPQVHEWLHSDAGEVEHECVLKILVQNGSISTIDDALDGLIPLPVSSGTISISCPVFLETLVFLQSDTRAPPLPACG